MTTQITIYSLFIQITISVCMCLMDLKGIMKKWRKYLRKKASLE